MNDDENPINAEGAGVAFRQPDADASPASAPSAPPSDDQPFMRMRGVDRDNVRELFPDRHEEPAALPRPPYQIRVVQEKEELDQRILRLSTFVASNTFNEIAEAERSRLIQQHSLMLQLSEVLAERIASFDA